MQPIIPKKKQPTTKGYTIGVFLLILSLLIVIVLVFYLTSKESNLIVVPGTKEIVFNEIGNYTVFYEYQSVVDDVVYSTDKRLPPIKMSATYKTTGESVPLKAVSGEYTYTIGDRKGKAIWDFSIKQSGVYEFSAFYNDNQKYPSMVFNIERDSLLITIITLAAFILSLSIGLFIIFVTWKKRTMFFRENKINEETITKPISCPFYFYWALPSLLCIIFILSMTGTISTKSNFSWVTILLAIISLIVFIPIFILDFKLFLRAAIQFEKDGDLLKTFYNNIKDLILLFKAPNQISDRFSWFKIFYYGSFFMPIVSFLYLFVKR